MESQICLTPYFIDTFSGRLLEITEQGWLINNPGLSGVSNYEKMYQYHKGIKSFIYNTVSANKIPINITGDCCSSIPVLAGLQKAKINPIVLWLDAHGDFNTHETSPSGFLGGMPLAMLVGKGDLTLNNAMSLYPINEQDIILSDARDLDPEEEIMLNSSNIKIVRSISELIGCDFGQRPIYLHFDTDILRLEDAPAQNYPAMGGASKDELNCLFTHLKTHHNICAITVSTWNPYLDKDGKTKKTCLDLLNTFIV